MTEQNNENLDSLNEETTEVVAETAEETTPEVEETEEVDVDALKAQNKKLYERAKKAEAEAKKLKQQPKESEPKTDSNLSLKDIRALQDVHEDDLEEVMNYAKFKGISIADAKKDSVVRTLLKNKEEERKTAEATSTGKTKRGVSSLSDEQVVEAAYSGKEIDPARLAEAQLALRRKKVS